MEYESSHPSFCSESSQSFEGATFLEVQNKDKSLNIQTTETRVE